MLAKYLKGQNAVLTLREKSFAAFVEEQLSHHNKAGFVKVEVLMSIWSCRTTSSFSECTTKVR